jgi:ribosomal protein L24E
MRIQRKGKILSSGNLKGEVNYIKKREVRRRIKWTTEKDSEYIE